jgi:hypothetical protein
VTAASGDAGAAGEPPALGYAALGAAAIAGAAAAGIARRGTATLARAFERAPSPVTNAVDSLASRGQRELANLVTTTEATIDWAAAFIARYPPMTRFVDQMVDAVLPSAIASALPEVLDQLAREPERIRPIVRSQRDDITDELVGLVRSRAAYGDELVDRVVDRVMFRRKKERGKAAQPADATEPVTTATTATTATTETAPPDVPPPSGLALQP